MFGGRQYYTLVAGLRRYSPPVGGGEGGVVSPLKGFDAAGIYGEIRRELSHSDRRAAGLVWSLADIYGLGRNRIEQLYALCAACGNDWLSQWARFDRNLRNVVAAHTARTKGRVVAEGLLTIEGDEIPLVLGKSSAADFNLRGELDYIDRLLGALDGSGNACVEDAGEQIVEKERVIDLIRWEKADSLAEGDTFGAPVILAYLVKVAITGRWAALDPVVGREMYEKLVNSLNRYGNKG